MFRLADGRRNVYQWDINVKLLLDESNESADEVHFSARFSRISLSVEVVHTEDSSYVTIPNILLQKPNDIIAYSYITNADGSYTKYDIIIPVIARPKPSGYVYTETETLTWKSLDDKINDLGESTANSVKYTEQELTDEQKAQARANIGAVSVGEVPEQVQVDNSQNDRSKPDFIKNRTHYQYTLGDIGYPVEFMDGTHNVGDIVLLRDISKRTLNLYYIPGINAPYTETQALYLKFKVTYSGGTYTINQECKDRVASDGSPIIEINEISSGNIKALYYSSRQPYIAWYFIADLTTLNDEDKTAFTKTGIYAQVVNDLDSASSIQIGCYIKQYVKLDSKYIDIPVATNDVAGVVKPVTKTEEMSQNVGVDAEGRLYTIPIASPMTGATADTDGAAGLVPAPKAGEQEKFLRGDGTWADVPQGGGGGTGNGDMQKTVYDPMGKATDVFAYAENTAESKVSAHNTESGSHSDIRELITGLTNRLNAIADSDDETLDQLSEIVAYIKSNKSLIDAITTNKVSVSDIVDNLTSSATNKPLSAAQGKALKALIDAITIPDKLPNPNALTFTGAVTDSYDGSSPLTVNIPSGGSGGSVGGGWELVSDTTLSEDVSQLEYTDLDCYDLRVAIYGRWNNADDSLSNANINANILMNEPGMGYQYFNGQIGYIRPSNSNFHTLIEATAANAQFPKIVVSLLPTGNAVSLKNQDSTFESLAPGFSWSNGKREKINRILIVPTTTGAMLKAGARIIAMKRS